MFTNREYSKQILFAFEMFKIKTRSISNIRNFSFEQNIRNFSFVQNIRNFSFVQNIRNFSCSNNNRKRFE